MEDLEMMIVNKKIGDMTESELKDFIIELQEENSRYERTNQKYKKVIKGIIEYLQSEEFKENFPYVANECQVRGAILNIIVGRITTADFNKLLDILK